jgi:hypothetical protein
MKGRGDFESKGRYGYDISRYHGISMEDDNYTRGFEEARREYDRRQEECEQQEAEEQRVDMKKHLTFEDGKDSEFNPIFPPPIHSSVDDFNFRKSGIGIFYMIGDVQWCDLPTSSWEQLSTTLRWIRKN